MEFVVELYETAEGRPVVEDELEALQDQHPALHILLVAGLNKLRHREYHRAPLCEPLGDGLFEVRVGRKDIARAAWFYVQGQRIVVVHCFVKKTQKTPEKALATARRRMADYQRRTEDR
jgi:phage-related protein